MQTLVLHEKKSTHDNKPNVLCCQCPDFFFYSAVNESLH